MNAHTISLLEAIENDMIIADDAGMKWYYRRGKIRLVSAELELKTEEEIEENGYHCNNFDDGVRLLKEFGYITESASDEENSHAFHNQVGAV